MRQPFAGLVLVSLFLVAPPVSAEESALELDAVAGAETAISGAPVMLEATLRNGGEGALEVYLPEHLGAIPFPRWVFEAENGERYLPHVASFQSMWETGLQGEILRLEAGQSRRLAMRVGSVVLIEDEKTTSGHGDGIPLPPGRYEITCTYTKADSKVPYGSDDMRMTRVWKPHEGLWTGTVRAKPLVLVVTPSAEPVLEIQAPEVAAMGARYPIRVVFTNKSAKRIVIDGAFEITASRKAYAAGVARFVFHDGRFHPADKGVSHAVYLDPAASIEGTIDLSAATFIERRGKLFLDAGFYDVAGPGLFHLTARFVDAHGENVATTAMFRRVRPLVNGAESGLALRVESGSTAKGTAIVDVVLENRGTKAIRVPATLTYPRNVFFALVSETPGKAGPIHRITRSGGLPQLRGDEPGPAAVLSEGLAWNGDRFEPSPRADRQTFVLLQPGSEMRRRISLAEILVVDGGALHGTYQLTAFYRNRQSGRRLGIDGVFVGILESASLRIVGGGS